MIKKAKRSSTYLGSVDNTEIGNAEITQVRLDARIFNAEQKLKALKEPGYEPKIRKVALFGRLGKNNPNAEKYRSRNRNSWRNAYQRIAIADAATLDIYVTDYVKRKDNWGNRWLTAHTANF